MSSAGDIAKCLSAILFSTLLSGSVEPAEGKVLPDAATQACWNQWYASRLAQQPKPEDTHHPVTGKPLSQTTGAKRSRERKLLALKDALELRGEDEPAWEVFLEGCITSKKK